MTFISTVAVYSPLLDRVWSAERPLRHGDLLNRLRVTTLGLECGFIHPVTGVFLTRMQAWDYAIQVDQPISGRGGIAGKLFSEDIW